MDYERINILMPKELLKNAKKLVDVGLFANLSEFLRESVRMNLQKYSNFETEKDKELKKIKQQ